VIFLEQAELRVKQKKLLTLDFWRTSVDRILQSNDQVILEDLGTVSHDAMKRIAEERYDTFDQNRRSSEAIAADAEDLLEIEDLEQQIKANKH
jgi:hypothetical protein